MQLPNVCSCSKLTGAHYVSLGGADSSCPSVSGCGGLQQTAIGQAHIGATYTAKWAAGHLFPKHLSIRCSCSCSCSCAHAHAHAQLMLMLLMLTCCCRCCCRLVCRQRTPPCSYACRSCPCLPSSARAGCGGTHHHHGHGAARRVQLCGQCTPGEVGMRAQHVITCQAEVVEKL